MPIRFQVDPDFYDHPKSIGLSDAATALWVRAGSYSAAKLTDGFIAEHVLPTLSRTPDEAADELKRRGLWHRVKGGYRFHQWDQRNLTRARVEGERASDRTRKAAERAAARRATAQARAAQGQNVKPQVNGHIVRPDSDRTPTGFQTESDGNPPVSVSVSVSGSVSGSGPPGPEPPPRCPEHVNASRSPPCGPCAGARRAHERWERDQAATTAAQQSQRARQAAETRHLAVAACHSCDKQGRLPNGAVCPHDPKAAERFGRGLALARAVIGRSPPASNTPDDADDHSPSTTTDEVTNHDEPVPTSPQRDPSHPR